MFPSVIFSVSLETAIHAKLCRLRHTLILFILCPNISIEQAHPSIAVLELTSVMKPKGVHLNSVRADFQRMYIHS